MVRTARAVVGGVCYHILNRGNDRKTVFHEAADFEQFLTIVGEASTRYPIELFAYCLMPNHFHFVVRPRDNDTLARWVHWLLTTHARAHRLCYETAGHIWQGRFRAFPIEHDDHLLTVIRYVERNALRANLVAKAEDWRWGSLNERQLRNRRGLLDGSPCALPREWGGEVNAAEAEAALHAIRSCVSTGRPYGSDAWVRQAESTLGAQFTPRPRGRPRKSEGARTPGALLEKNLFD
ncbi:MAG TPA: transposase [Gammaproteobacteria bacterium]|nr:transposase [Gammaproteobacteria bacterium]